MFGEVMLMAGSLRSRRLKPAFWGGHCQCQFVNRARMLEMLECKNDLRPGLVRSQQVIVRDGR